MDIISKLIIVVVLGAFYAPSHAATYTPDFGELKVIDGDIHIIRGNGTTSLMYPDAGLSKSIDVSTSKGNFPVPVEKSFPVVPAKVAKSATRFLRSLPVIGTGLAIYDMVCDLSEICKDENGNLAAVENPYTVKTTIPTCGDPFGYYYYHYSNIYDRFWRGPANQKPVNYTIYTYCDGYTTIVASSNLPPLTVLPEKTTRPVTEADWASAETKLSAQPQQAAEALYNSDAPVPVDASTQSSPVTQQISQISTQTKDSQGNITGTQIETTSVKVEDTSTASNVTYNVTEITTVTNYNENNEITSTQTSTADTEQPKAAEDTDISFDNVSDAQLETEEIDVQLETPVSWGEGTCPPDETLTLQGRSYSISYEPACDAAADLRPIFVLLASVTALFIVAGVSRTRGD